MAITPLDPLADLEAGHRPLAEINVTPFVDVMLVLLIIFMVAAPLMMVAFPLTCRAPLQQKSRSRASPSLSRSARTARFMSASRRRARRSSPSGFRHCAAKIRTRWSMSVATGRSRTDA